MQRCITVKNPACYDLDPYINGEAMVHDSGESWVYAYTGVISEIKIYM